VLKVSERSAQGAVRSLRGTAVRGATVRAHEPAAPAIAPVFATDAQSASRRGARPLRGDFEYEFELDGNPKR